MNNDVPSEIIEAALKVENYAKSQGWGKGWKFCGIQDRLADSVVSKEAWQNLGESTTEVGEPTRGELFEASQKLAAQEPFDNLKRLYEELLYQVKRKFEGESRHETALRYIKDAENIVNEPNVKQNS